MIRNNERSQRKNCSRSTLKRFGLKIEIVNSLWPFVVARCWHPFSYDVTRMIRFYVYFHDYYWMRGSVKFSFPLLEMRINCVPICPSGKNTKFTKMNSTDSGVPNVFRLHFNSLPIYLSFVLSISWGIVWTKHLFVTMAVHIIYKHSRRRMGITSALTFFFLLTIDPKRMRAHFYLKWDDNSNNNNEFTKRNLCSQSVDCNLPDEWNCKGSQKFVDDSALVR